MKLPIKALLLSALIYPGAGHFLLKKTTRGAILAGLFSIPLFLKITDSIRKMNQMIEQIVTQIERGEIPFDILIITESVSKLSENLYTQSFNIKLYLMLFIWGVAILDVYRIANKKA